MSAVRLQDEAATLAQGAAQAALACVAGVPEMLKQSIFDSLPQSIIATDAQGVIMDVNPAACALLGHGREDMLGRAVLGLVHEAREVESRARELSHETGQRVAPDFSVLTLKARQGQMEEREWSYRRQDASTLPVNVLVTALRNAAGEIYGYLEVAHDVSERKRAEAYIRHMAHHDSLTSLPNRALMLDRLDMAIRRARRDGLQVAVLLMDLDHFKRINDSLGHHMGDKLLLVIAARLQFCLRETDTVARLGGDEFVLILTDVRSQDDLNHKIEDILARVATPISVENHELLVTPSIGGSLFPKDGSDANTLLKHADAAMYQAKALGRNTWQWFSHDMVRATAEKLALTSALRFAVERKELYLHYQPLVSLVNGQVTGMEALVRWQHPDRGLIPPDSFIGLAEENGQILQIGEWILNAACAESARIQKQLGRPLTVAVNVSPRQLQQKNFVLSVEKAIEASGLSPTSLELEITEGLLMRDPKESAAILRKIRDLGVGIVIDDFGTGYSSLSYIMRFPIDKLKIDRSFIRDLKTDEADAAVINAILAMARSLHIEVVAEGVETPEQLSYLRDRSCDQAQGYYFGRPVSGDEFLRLAASLDVRNPWREAFTKRPILAD